MILQMFRWVHVLDVTLKTTLGRPYNIVLSIGLVLEIIQQFREIHEVAVSSTSIGRLVIGIVFYALLLIHQLGEIWERGEKRTPESETEHPRG